MSKKTRTTKTRTETTTEPVDVWSEDARVTCKTCGARNLRLTQGGFIFPHWNKKLGAVCAMEKPCKS